MNFLNPAPAAGFWNIIQEVMNTLVWGNSLTISGSGKLKLRSDKPNLGCVGPNAYISIGKNVKIDASNTGALKSAMVVADKLLSTSYRYAWSKKAREDDFFQLR